MCLKRRSLPYSYGYPYLQHSASVNSPEATILLVTKGAFLHRPPHITPRQHSGIDCTPR